MALGETAAAAAASGGIEMDGVGRPRVRDNEMEVVATICCNLDRVIVETRTHDEGHSDDLASAVWICFV
jgi:hypothetical protein